MDTINNLFPVFEMPPTLAVETRRPQRYHPAPLFDIERGEFILNGARQAAYGSGSDAWVLWCTKMILTQRFAHLAYGDDIGVEAEEAFRQPDRRAQESAFERTITEALLADSAGRTKQVRGFSFRWGADSLHISCEIIGHDGNSASIDVDMKR